MPNAAFEFIILIIPKKTPHDHRLKKKKLKRKKLMNCTAYLSVYG